VRRPIATLVAFVLLTAVAAPRAGAHQQGISYSDVEIVDGVVRYDLTMSAHDVDTGLTKGEALSSEQILREYPRLRAVFERALTVTAGGTPCPLLLQDFESQPNERVLFRLRGRCPDTLPVHVAVRLRMLTTVDGYNLAKIRVRNHYEEHIFDRLRAEVTIGEATGGFGATFRRFFVLGVEHIATGYDHVLFLLALLLVGGGLRALVAIVTAFTIAHSVTLTLAVLDVVQLPARFVESVIALSIAWVALENILIDRARGRWRITFAFGLVHGFGFATILRELHLPREGLVASLLAFNLGVEAGQLVVVLLASPVVALIQRSRHRRLVIGLASGAIGVLALLWFVERAFD
jgi:hypothetical protein